ncbi:MAG: hypothetical protein LBN10_05440 [Propionibacteriaceae bacterium]|nr:hypothetical protein [Propionibacteriaceae bacterium]
MTETATIRVPVAVRDNFAKVAKYTGKSMSSYLAGLSREVLFTAIRDSAREEAIKDAQNPAAAEEYALWEETLADGID